MVASMGSLNQEVAGRPSNRSNRMGAARATPVSRGAFPRGVAYPHPDDVLRRDADRPAIEILTVPFSNRRHAP